MALADTPPTLAAQIEAQSAIDLIDDWMKERRIALPHSDLGALAKRLEIWRAPATVTALRQAEVKDQRYSIGHCKDCPGDHSRMCCQNQTSDGSSVPPLRQAEAAPGVVEADKPACPCCHLTDVSFERTCHNSDCELYAEPTTFYEGWLDPTALARQPTASPPIEVERTVADGAQS